MGSNSVQNFSQIEQSDAELLWFKNRKFEANPTLDFTIGGFQSYCGLCGSTAVI